MRIKLNQIKDVESKVLYLAYHSNVKADYRHFHISKDSEGISSIEPSLNNRRWTPDQKKDVTNSIHEWNIFTCWQ